MFTVSQRFTKRSDSNCYDFEHVWRMYDRQFATLQDALAFAANCCQSYKMRIHDGETVYNLEWVEESADSDYCLPTLVRD